MRGGAADCGGNAERRGLASALLARTAEREPAVEAWQFIDAEAVLAAARAADRAPSGGMLRGIPIGVKDVIDTVDMPTAYGSAAYAGHRPAADAACVAAGAAAGAVVLGKTVATEFAALAPGKTKNPHDPGHTPGGSSSGSAAAVAAGHGPARDRHPDGRLGDPPGRVLRRHRLQAELRPDRARRRQGAFGQPRHRRRVCPRVGDAALFAAVLADRPRLAAAPPPATLRVGLYRTSDWDRADAATHAAIERTAAMLRARGATLIDIAATADHAALIAAQTAIMGWETLRALTFERLNKFAQLAPTTQNFLRNAETISLADYDAAQARMPALRAASTGCSATATCC